jgi:hypothetical protein
MKACAISATALASEEMIEKHEAFIERELLWHHQAAAASNLCPFAPFLSERS